MWRCGDSTSGFSHSRFARIRESIKSDRYLRSQSHVVTNRGVRSHDEKWDTSPHLHILHISNRTKDRVTDNDNMLTMFAMRKLATVRHACRSQTRRDRSAARGWKRVSSSGSERWQSCDGKAGRSPVLSLSNWRGIWRYDPAGSDPPCVISSAVRGERRRRADPITHEMWTSDEQRDRDIAVKWCQGCSLLELCGSAADERREKVARPRRQGPHEEAEEAEASSSVTLRSLML